MRNFQRPFSFDPAVGQLAVGTHQLGQLPMSKSFEADALAALLKGEGNDGEKGKELSMQFAQMRVNSRRSFLSANIVFQF